jgi:hypothetical protein
MSTKNGQPYTLENPEPRKVEVEVNESQGSGKVPVYEADPTRVDLSPDFPERESRLQVDVTVGPDDPNAVIVPPEGRGEHPRLFAGGQTPEEALSSGDAVEATGQEDGKTVTSSEAAKADDKS